MQLLVQTTADGSITFYEGTKENYGEAKKVATFQSVILAQVFMNGLVHEEDVSVYCLDHNHYLIGDVGQLSDLPEIIIIQL